MKRFYFLVALLIGLIVVITACGGPAPAEVVDAHVKALNAGDITALAAIYTDDVVFSFGPVPPEGAFETLTGKTEVLADDLESIAKNGQLTLSNTSVEGDTVKGEFSFTDDELKDGDVDQITGTFEIMVQGGKIASIKPTLDTETQQKLAAAFAPPSPQNLTVLAGGGQDTVAIVGLVSDAPEEIAQEVQRLVEDALAEASPKLVSQTVADMLADMMAERPAPITKAEVEQLIQVEVASLRELLEDTSSPPATVPKPTIVFSGLNWDSARLQNSIAMFIIEHGYGYPVDQIAGDTLVLWDNLLDGDSLVTMEVWLPNQQEAWDQAIFDGSVIPLGKSLDANWQRFVVPTYMLNQFSNFYDVRQLPERLDEFVPIGERLKPRAFDTVALVTCPIDTECYTINQAKIEAYGLENHVEVVVPSSLSALQESLERAYSNGEPWLGYMWGPSRLSEELDLTILEEPEYTEDCWATTKGCAYPTAQVLVAVHPSMLRIAPELVEFLRQWDFTARRQTGTEKWMHDNDATTEEAAAFFLKTWPTVWTEWVPEDVANRVREAVAQ